MGGLQDLAHVEMMKPITKFATSVPSTERIADFIGMAAREALTQIVRSVVSKFRAMCST